MGSKENF